MKKVQKSRVDLACNACWVIVFTLLTFGFHVSTVEAQQIRIGSGVHFVNSTTVVVKGDSLVNRGTLKNGAHGVIELTGNLKNHGTFTNETGSIITLDGTNPQTIGGSVPTTFNTLNLGNSAGVTLAKDATVNGSLNFQTGILTTGSNLLTIAETGAIGNAAATRYVDGKLAHIFNEADTKIFPIGKDGNYRPVVLQLFTLTGTSLVTAEQFESGLTGTLPSDVTLTTTNRKWTITQSGGSDMQYFVRLDATGYTPERPVVMLKKDAGLITSHETTTPDYTNTGAFTSFSDFGLGEECVNPTGGGTIEGEQTICTDESPTELTGDIPPDFIGTLEYQWQVSITSSTEEFSIIDDTDSQDYTPTSVTQTSWFKRLSRVDCKTDWTGAAESNVVEITVNQPVRRYVTMYGAGLKDGSSWDNAYDKTQLQDAINEFCVNEVWVAAGTYLPTLEVGGTGSRYRSFQMKNGVAIYGGFASNEASDYDLSLRNFATNETILSGDLDRNDNFNSASGGYQITTGDDNCYHVFCHPSTMTPVLTNTAVLDGFTISGGNANGIPTNDVFDYGGGIYNYGCSPTIRNTIFKNNAAFFGGGLYNEYSSNPTITRTDFINNYAHQDGGGIYNWESSSPVISEVTISNNYGIRYGGGLCNHSFCNPAITNVTINNNTAWDGGGIYNRYYSAPTFTNVLISNNLAYYAGDNGWGGGVSNEYNSAPVFTNTTISNNTVVNGFGGGVYNYSSSTATFNNSIIWGNNATITSNGGNQFYLEPETSSALFYSCYADGSGNVVGNLSASNSTTLDPQFVNSGNGDFRLWTTSPCLDEGSDGYNNENCDIRGIGFERKLLKTDHTLTGTIDMGAYEYKEGTDPLGCGNPTNGGIIASNQTVCLGSIPLEIESTSLPSGHTGDIEFQWQESTASAITGFSNITGANDTTFQAGTLFDTTWFRRLARVSCKSDWTGCDTSNVVKITIEPTPVSGTLAKTPNQTTVCEGDNVSAALTAGSGGSSVDSTYYRTKTSSGWSSWANYASGTNITTTGKTEVEVQTKRKGTECDDASWTTVSWTIEQTPVSGTLAKAPNQTTVCEGDNVSAALTAGSGGSSVDSTYYRTKTSSGWSSWANYASGTNITTTGKTEVEVHTKRKGAACDDATWTTVSWTVEQTPVSGTLAKSPDVTNVCEGDNVSAALTAGSGGSSVDSTYYRTKTITGWSSWANYASGTNITTTGKTEVEVHTKRKGAECDDATWTTVSWTVEQTPVSGTLVKIPDQAIVCEGDGVSASLTVGSGGNGTDSTYYRTNNGNSWSDWAAYTSGSNISTSGKTFVEIQTKRKADFCNDAGFNTISWSVQAIPVAFAGNNATLVMGESYTLSEATAENEDSISWSTDGDGSFDDRTAINATYTPGSEDISSGDLQLCINVEPLSPCLLQASDCMKITILRNPTISITSPVDGSSVYTNPVTISGTAADADGNLSLIQVKLNSGIWKTATGTDIWTIDLNLNPGKNTILARAKDASDLYSDTATIKVLLSIQIINIPKGWSAISSYLTPINPGLQVMMNEITNNNNLVIMLSENGVYWPSQNYNTIGNWNVEQGYKVKMNIAREFTVRGDSLTSRSLDLSEGYHIIPVLSNVACPITSVFIDPLNDIFFMYDVRTNALYWPRGEIFSLTTLLPGKGYIASFNKAVTLTYPAYSGLKTGIITNNTEPELDGPWALVRTGDVHFISIKNEALKKLENASFMGAFDSFGNCIGYTEVDRRGGNYLLSVYGNDAYTDAKDGAEEAEPISFRSFSSSTQTETELIAEYNASFPNDDGLFASNGQSSIINFKESSTGIGEAGIAVDVLIYPNPAKDELNIAIKGFRTLQGFGTLMSAEGKLVKTFVLTGNQTQLNVQDLQPGVYMLRIENAENVVIKRVVIQ